MQPSTRLWTRILALGLFCFAFGLAACNQESGGGGVVSGGAPRPPQVASPGSGLFAIDCNAQKAYVPLDTLDVNGNGQIAVLDLTADPDTTNPLITTISLGAGDIPTGTAFDSDHGLILVVTGQTFGVDGELYVIDEATNTQVAGSPFPFPAGTQPGFTGQVLYNPGTKMAVVATCDSFDCESLGDPLEGFATFDPVADTFGPIVPANYPETFALNGATNTVISASDEDNFGEIGIVDLSAGRTCTLSDPGIGSDNDGASTDLVTNISVVSNEDGTASVINLNGATSAPPAGTPCAVTEGGTPPNSVLISGLPSETAGSAVDASRDQAFLIEDGSSGITLLQLPSSPKTQLTAGDISKKISAIPNDPFDLDWETQGDPYAVAIDSCKNRGYAVNFEFTFLVGVDLAKMKSSPKSLSKALPAGNCAGTATTSSCKNGQGVIFYPLPSADGAAAAASAAGRHAAHVRAHRQ